MKFRVERDTLADAVAWAARSLPARPPMPVLAGLLLNVAGETLTVSSFDFEVSAQVGVGIASASDGTGLVSGRLLAEITRSLPAHPVDVTDEGNRLLVTCGSARFTLPTMPVEDYPAIPAMPEASGVIGSDAFAAAVSQVAVAAGRDDTLPVLTGVRIEIDDDTVTLAATDRYRLAVRELKWQPATPGQTVTALVPARTLAESARSLTSGAEVTVALATGGAGEGMIGFVGGGRRTTTRLLDGEFPKYRSLFPAEYAATAQVPTQQFVEAIKRVALVTTRNASVRLRFTTDLVTLEAGGGEDAEATESLECSFRTNDGNDGNAGNDGAAADFVVGFNPGYLLDGLAAIDSDTASLGFTTPTKPAVITSKDSGTDYSYLIMPVRLPQ